MLPYILSRFEWMDRMAASEVASCTIEHFERRCRGHNITAGFGTNPTLGLLSPTGSHKTSASWWTDRMNTCETFSQSTISSSGAVIFLLTGLAAWCICCASCVQAQQQQPSCGAPFSGKLTTAPTSDLLPVMKSCHCLFSFLA